MMSRERHVSHDEVRASRVDVLGDAETEMHKQFVDMVRATALGVVWPSVVVERKHMAFGVRVRVQGLAFRFHGGAA